MSRRWIAMLALAASPLAALAHGGDDGGAHHGFAAGADACISKSDITEQLVPEIERLARRHP